MEVTGDGSRGEPEDLGKVRLNLWITREQMSRLKALSDHEGRTVSDIVRQVINTCLQENTESIDKQTERKGKKRERRIER